MLPVPPAGYGAVERHVWNLAQSLRALGHDVEIVSRVFGRAPWNEYRFARWALRETRRLGCDVVHAHTTGVAATFAAAGRPFVYTSHSRHWMTAHGLRERAGFALERYAVRRARAVIALTEDVAAKMPRTATVVPNGVDPAAFRPDWGARTGRTALAVGVVAPHKGHALAARAAREAGWRLVVAGPPGDPAYAARVRAEGAQLRGAVTDAELGALYAASDAFLHLSQSEALSLAVLEAMASALPLVASDVCKGQVIAGETGFPIPSVASEDARVAAARAALASLGDDALRRRLGEGARAVAIRDFSWGAVAARVANVYEGARA